MKEQVKFSFSRQSRRAIKEYAKREGCEVGEIIQLIRHKILWNEYIRNGRSNASQESLT